MQLPKWLRPKDKPVTAVVLQEPDAMKKISSFDAGPQIQNFLANWNVASYSTWDARREVQTYIEIDDIYSIISLLARSAATIPFYGFTVKDDEAMKAYKRQTSDSIQKKYYQLKSMEDLPESDPVAKLLENPNGSRYEFFCASYTQIFINGEVFFWKERIEFGVNKGVVKLHMLHPSDMIVFVSRSFPQQVTGYRFITPYGETIDFLPDEIIHVKYCNPSNLYQQQFRGLSPMRSSQKRLARVEGSMDVSVSQMQNGGVPGVIFDEVGAGTLEAQEVGAVRKTAFLAHVNSMANKGGPYWASGKLGWIPLGLSVVDLDLINLSKEDFNKLANNYHVSTILLNNTEASTESNVKEQTKRMYTNGILPTVYQFRDALITGLLPDFKGAKRYIECDMSGITELQPDMKVTADALKLMDFITPNEKRKIMRFDDSDEQFMNSIIIDSGKMLLDDLGGVADPKTSPDEIID